MEGAPTIVAVILCRLQTAVHIPRKGIDKMIGRFSRKVLVFGNGDTADDRQVVVFLASVRTQTLAFGFDFKQQGEHRFRQAVGNADGNGLFRALDRGNTRPGASQSHRLDGLERDDDIAVQAAEFVIARDTDGLAADGTAGVVRGEMNGSPAYGTGIGGRIVDGQIRNQVFFTGRHRPFFHRDGGRIHIHGSVIDITHQKGVQELVVRLLGGEGMGHPRLNRQAAVPVRNIGQVAGVDIGGHIGASGRRHGRCRRVMPLREDFTDDDLVFEIAVNRIILRVHHQIHFVEIISFVFQIVRIAVMTVHNHIRRRNVYRRNGPFVQIDGAVRSDGGHTPCAIHEIVY